MQFKSKKKVKIIINCIRLINYLIKIVNKEEEHNEE